MEGGKVHKTNAVKVKEKPIKEKPVKVKHDKKTEFISNETTKEIVHLFTNSQQMKDYSKFINETFPVETTTTHVNKHISYYLGKS